MRAATEEVELLQSPRRGNRGDELAECALDVEALEPQHLETRASCEHAREEGDGQDAGGARRVERLFLRVPCLTDEALHKPAGGTLGSAHAARRSRRIRVRLRWLGLEVGVSARARKGLWLPRHPLGWLG